MDCRNIFILRQELDRMCESMTSCKECGLSSLPISTGCGDLNEYGIEEVDVVQKWSDEHPIDYGEDD